MRDLSFCHRPFDPAARGIPSHEPRFLQIADLAQRAQYAEAADAIEALHQEQLFDARLWGYYLYRAFEEDGCARLGELFEAIQALTTRDWGEVLPKEKAPVQLNRSVSWLFQTLLAAVQYHQTSKDSTWERWIRGLDEAGMERAIAGAEALLKGLPEPAFHQSIELLSRVLRWMRELAAQLRAQAAAAEKADSKRSETMSATQDESPAPETGPAAGQTLQLRGSPKLWELLGKLKAFEALVEKRAFPRAALVGDDIIATIEAFDPRDYFPELFARFGALFHAHVQEISPHWQSKDSMDWKAMAQFYQVDLDRFVKD